MATPSRRLGRAAAILALALSLAAGSFAAVSDAPVADAAMRGDTATVRSLLRDGADVNAAQGDGMTALHWAAANDDLDTLEVLLYAGAALEPTTRLGGYTPLHLAAREGSSAAVSALLEAGGSAEAMTSTGATALHLAAEAGAPDAIRSLIEHGADVDARDVAAARTPLVYAAAYGRLASMEVLLEAGADPTLATRTVDYTALAEEDNAERRRRARLVAAAQEPEPEEDRQAARGGGPPGAGPRPGAAQGRGGAAQRAQQPPDPPTTPPADPDRPTTPSDPDEPDEPDEPDDAGTPDDPDRPDPGPNAPEALSYTEQVGVQGGLAPIHFAARDGHRDAVMLLLEAGTDIDLRTLGDDTSPMLMAIINGNFDLAMELLEAGADPDAVSEDGVGPLFATINNEWALRTWYPQPTAAKQQETSYLELMEALLEAGADPDERLSSHLWYAAYNAGRMGVDFTGATPFWRAAYATDVAAMKLLVEYGADPNLSTIKTKSRRNRFFPGYRPPDDEEEADPSGLPPVPPGGPAVHPLHAASGVGYGTSRVGQQHRHVPDGWLPAVRYLVEELGVDVNVRDDDGYTALHNAAARGDNEMIEFLVEHGADVMVVSRRGQTTVDMANGPQQRVQPFPDTIALLESLGAINNHNCRSC